MVNKDTIRLLRECDSGVKMGIESIDDCIPHVTSQRLKGAMLICKDEHRRMKKEIRGMLDRYHDGGKNPNPLITGMSKMKTGMKLMMSDTDKTVAGLMTDGCNMGIKSLSGYLNKFKAADEDSKEIAKQLIATEEQLAKDMRGFL
jgi:hypothetical protein